MKTGGTLKGSGCGDLQDNQLLGVWDFWHLQVMIFPSCGRQMGLSLTFVCSVPDVGLCA